MPIRKRFVVGYASGSVAESAIGDAPPGGFAMIEMETMSRLLDWTGGRFAGRLSAVHRAGELLRAVCPEFEQLEIVKVAGTNGKGSVCAMLRMFPLVSMAQR